MSKGVFLKMCLWLDKLLTRNKLRQVVYRKAADL
jgi:hypothetical protein